MPDGIYDVFSALMNIGIHVNFKALQNGVFCWRIVTTASVNGIMQSVVLYGQRSQRMLKSFRNDWSK